MILRLGQCTDPESGESVSCPAGSATGAAPATSSLPPFCDPDWTTINGGVCTDALGNYRTATGATVSGDMILSALKTGGYGAPKTTGLPFGLNTTTFAFILGGVFFFALVLPRGRR